MLEDGRDCCDCRCCRCFVWRTPSGSRRGEEAVLAGPSTFATYLSMGAALGSTTWLPLEPPGLLDFGCFGFSHCVACESGGNASVF